MLISAASVASVAQWSDGRPRPSNPEREGIPNSPLSFDSEALITLIRKELHMINRFLLAIFLPALLVPSFTSAQPPDFRYFDHEGENWDSSSGSDESGGGSSYLGVDIADVSAERLAELKLKEEHGAEVTMVDQDAPAGKAGLHEHEVIVSLNGTALESAAQLRRMIKETPPGRVVTLGISRDGQSLTIKVQLADKHKSMAWEPKIHPEMPKVQIPNMPDFDLPVSVVIVHSSARSGLMV